MHFQSHFGLILSFGFRTYSDAAKFTFNPILVWFYLYRKSWTGRWDTKTFNPILVWFYLYDTLKDEIEFDDSFNPILVWFYLDERDKRNSRTISFQSHFGLILSLSNQNEVFDFFDDFQSHFGLILSIAEMMLRVFSESAFNPILVWFYLLTTARLNMTLSQLSIPFWSDFISCCNVLSLPSQRNFQSHFGLILSHVGVDGKRLKRIAFNPILVWFYQELQSCCFVCWSCLSIPFWSDFILWSHQRSPRSSELSIPFWSDFIQE